MYAGPHRRPESLYGIADRASAADRGGRTVERGEELVPDHIYLFPAVAGQLLADEHAVLRLQLAPPAVAVRDEPFHHAHQVDEEHRREHPPWHALACIQRPE